MGIVRHFSIFLVFIDREVAKSHDDRTDCQHQRCEHPKDQPPVHLRGRLIFSCLHEINSFSQECAYIVRRCTVSPPRMPCYFVNLHCNIFYARCQDLTLPICTVSPKNSRSPVLPAEVKKTGGEVPPAFAWCSRRFRMRCTRPGCLPCCIYGADTARSEHSLCVCDLL